MRLFLNLNYDITSLNSWIFISLTMKNVLFTVWSSLIDLSFEDLFLLDDLFTIANFAFVFLINYFSLATTVITWSLALSVHARSKLLHDNLDTSALASTTVNNGTSFSTFAVAFIANSIPTDYDLRNLSIV
jgi:hypothetical protein